VSLFTEVLQTPILRSPDPVFSIEDCTIIAWRPTQANAMGNANHNIQSQRKGTYSLEQTRRANGAPNPPPRSGASARHLPARIEPGCFVTGDFSRRPDASVAMISTPRTQLSVDGIDPILPYHC